MALTNVTDLQSVRCNPRLWAITLSLTLVMPNDASACLSFNVNGCLITLTTQWKVWINLFLSASQENFDLLDRTALLRTNGRSLLFTLKTSRSRTNHSGTLTSPPSVGHGVLLSLNFSVSLLQFSSLYLLSFFIIILGLVLFSSSSTYVAQDPRVYKPFRNISSQPASDGPPLSPRVLEPSVTYTSLGPDTGDELPVRVA